MASTYSPNLRLELIGTGEQQGTWGSTTNTNLGTLIEEAIGGYTSVTVSDAGDTTLTTSNGSADQARNMVLNLTGTIAATRNVIVPAIEKVYIIKNATTGGFAVTVKVSGQTGVSIANGDTMVVYVDGTDVRSASPTLGTMSTQNANNVSITGGSVVANASSLSVRDSDGSHIMSFAVGSNLTANRVFTLTTGDAARTLNISAGNVTISTAGAALIDDASNADQRTTLGLGTIATQNSNNVTITGGSISGITDLALADGGTGQSLSDPGADAVLGWNDTSNTMRFFTAGTGISINATSNTISSTVSGGGDYAMQVYTTPGPSTWTKPAGLKAVRVTVVGGGGGGGRGSPTPQPAPAGSPFGNSGSGGGGGGVAIEYIPAPSIPGPVAVTVGGGGAAGASPGTPAAGSGGTSSFGPFTSATGGGAGAAVPSSGGAGGAGSGGTINFTGQSGQNSFSGGPGGLPAGRSDGGSSPTGQGGRGPGGAGTVYGGGGGAGTSPPSSSIAGGAGSGGAVIVEEFY
jgi:hypothetical protein